MVQGLKLFLISILLSVLGFANIIIPATVSGVIQDAGGNVATSGTVEFDISPASSSIHYYVPGVATVVPLSTVCGITSTGTLVSMVGGINTSNPCTVWGNDMIAPANTTYTVVFSPGGVQTSSVSQEVIIGQAYNLNNPVFAPQAQLIPQYNTIVTAPLQGNIVPSANNLFTLGNAQSWYSSAFINVLHINTCIGAGCGTGGSGGSGMTWTGTCSSTPVYAALSACTYGGSSYITPVLTTGVLPPNSPWQVMALQGSVGPTGAAGTPGSTGATGPTGATGANGTNGTPIVWLGSFSSAPSSPAVDNAYYDTTLKKSLVWNGTVWNQMAQDGSAGPNSVSTSTTTAMNGMIKGNGTNLLTGTAGTDYITPSTGTFSSPVLAPSFSAGASTNAINALGGGNGDSWDEGSCTGVVPTANVDLMCADSVTHKFLYSCNGSSLSTTPCGGGGGGSAVWPPSFSGLTFTPGPGSVTSGTTVTTSCSGGAPYISCDGTTVIAGATGCSVTSTKTLYGECAGSGYNYSSTGSYTVASLSNLGNATIETTSDYVTNYLTGSTFVAGATGTYSGTAHVYCGNSSGTVLLGVYATSGGSPSGQALLASSGNITCNPTAGWQTASISVAVTSGATYFLGLNASNAGVVVYYTSGGNGYYGSFTWTGALPSTAPTMTSDGNLYSEYVSQP